MKIRLTSVYVDDQDKALRFYTQVAGFVKKGDFSQGGYRWLTVASAEEPDGTELQLARNDNPAAKAYQEAHDVPDHLRAHPRDLDLLALLPALGPDQRHQRSLSSITATCVAPPPPMRKVESA
jgi:catechol 2,3-dioxygenase-like lactoylglutathione lyase family enzyme